MNRSRDIEMEHALLKRCPFCGGYVQGRAETFHGARIALRNAMGGTWRMGIGIRKRAWRKPLSFLAPRTWKGDGAQGRSVTRSRLDHGPPPRRIPPGHPGRRRGKYRHREARGNDTPGVLVVPGSSSPSASKKDADE